MAEPAPNDDAEGPGGARPAEPRAKRAPSRAWRWLRRAVAVILGVVVLAVVGALYFVESDKARELAREAAADHGLALDYRRLALSPTRGELRLEGFRLPMPERCRAFGDDWLSVATLDVRWEPGAILDGIVRGLRVGLDDVALVHAVDAEGVDCTQLALAALLEAESPPSDPTPLSQTLASLTVPEGFELASLAVRGLRVRYVDASRVVEGSLEGSLEGLGIEAHAREEGGRLRGELVLASDAEGTRLRFGDVEATFRTEHRVTLGDEVALASSATLLSLSDAPPWVDVEALDLPRELLTLAAEARFEPDDARTSLRLTRLSVLGDVAQAEGAVRLRDDPAAPLLPEGSARFDLAPVAALLPSIVDLELEGVRGSARATPEGGQVRLALEVEAGKLALPEERASAEALRAEATGTLHGSRVSLQARLEASRLGFREGAQVASFEGAVLDARATELALDGSGGGLVASLELSQVSARAGADEVSARGLSLGLDAPSVRAPTVSLRATEVLATAGDARASLPTLEVALAARSLDLPAWARGDDAAFAEPLGLEGSVRAPSARVALGETRVEPRQVAISLAGSATRPSELALRVGLRAGSVEARADALRARVEGWDATVTLDELVLGDAPRGRLALRLDTRRVDLRDALQHVVIDGLGLTSQAPFSGGVPSRLSGTLPLRTVRFATADREPTAIVERGELSWTISELRLDPVLARSRANVSAEVRLWPVAGAEPVETEEERAAREARRAERRARRIAEAEARGEAPPPEEPRERTLHAALRGRFDRGAGELSVELRGRTVAMLGPLLGLDELALERARARLSLRGTYAGLDLPEPTLAHHGELQLRRLGLRGEGEALVFPRITATLDHRGRAALHEATLRVAVEAPTLGEQTLPHGLTLVTTARANLATLEAHVEMRSEDAGELELGAVLDARLEPSGRLGHRERFTARGLAGLAAWMPTVPVRIEALELEGEGGIEHAIDAATPTFEQALQARVTDVSHVEGERRVSLPELRFEASLRGDPSSYSGEAAVHVPLLDVVEGLHHVTFHDAEQRVRLVSRGPLADLGLDVHVDATLARVEQDVLPAYPMEELTLDVDLAIDGVRSLRMEHFALVNARGGTRLEMNKTLDRGAAFALDESAEGMATDAAVEGDLAHEGLATDTRRVARRGEHLVLRGVLEQDLARLDGAPEELSARGRLALPFTLESGDGALFRLHARAQLEDVSVSLPQMGIVLQGVRASVPVEEAFELSEDGGLALVANTERSPFARVRHHDLQPLLDGDTFVQVERIRVGEVELGPLAGSLLVDRNVFAIEGVRLERDEALITGQVLVDYLPGRESVTFRGNITGLRTRTSRTPLDANCAVVFSPSRLELDGRVQIVRVATAHLRGLLDLLDPYREDPSFNSLRSVLRFAHPTRVTLDLSQGLMSLEVELGGVVGRFLDVSAIRGIALGPFMNRHVAPLLGAR